MRGERLAAAFAGFAGIYGDRIYAFTSTANPRGFPYLTGRTQQTMLQYQPRFRNAALAAEPTALIEAEQLSPGSGLTLIYADPADLQVEVRTPNGDWLSIGDPALLTMLTAGIDARNVLALVKSQRALTDCRPLSLFSMQSVCQLEQELGMRVDLRRFRANVYVDLESAGGFAEDAWVGKTLKIGAHVVVRVLKRDARCKMITLDPETGAANPALFKQVQRNHEGMAGIYGAMLVEGVIREGDAVELLD